MKHRLLFVVWVLASVAFIVLVIYMFQNGSDSDTTKLAGDIGVVWGATAAWLIGPAWKAVRQWPKRRQMFLLSGLAFTIVFIGILFKIRVDQTTKLKNLFSEIHDIGTKGAPQKQEFMKLTRENPQSLPEYLQRCAELEPVINDYAASEQQMDGVLAQVQQNIGHLRPQGSYGRMLPMLNVMRTILAKDLEGAKFFKQEVQYAKQLPAIPAKDRIQFYQTNIEPVIEQENRIAQDEQEILKDAKAYGIAMPDNMLRDAGIK